ncbi:MAG: ethanolamine utilization protein EutJ [Acidimicrobiia bacterium]|nr:ethanolamine utilization protein EutJ [Acidimicrobiia bacterium]
MAPETAAVQGDVQDGHGGSTARIAGFLHRAGAGHRRVPESWSGDLQFGVDLGTASIVLCAVDADNEPAWWDSRSVQAVRDGVVVDFAGAVAATRELVDEAEETLGVRVSHAATAAPPGVPVSDRRACHYVVEQAGVECRGVNDEISAAQEILGVVDGAIVDVGGGSTGVGVYRNRELVSLTDLPGGGHHLDLILAGALGISIEEAEEAKRTDGAAHLGVLKAGVERIAESIRSQCSGVDPGPVHLAGGALLLAGADEIVADRLGWRTVSYPNAHLITPFGIARSFAAGTADGGTGDR